MSDRIERRLRSDLEIANENIQALTERIERMKAEYAGEVAKAIAEFMDELATYKRGVHEAGAKAARADERASLMHRRAQAAEGKMDRILVAIGEMEHMSVLRRWLIDTKITP